jgi:hypothetical protein
VHTHKQNTKGKTRQLVSFRQHKCNHASHYAVNKYIYTVTLHLQGRIVEPKGTVVARQRRDKHVSAATNTHATTEELLEAMFSMQSVSMLYSDGHWE